MSKFTLSLKTYNCLTNYVSGVESSARLRIIGSESDEKRTSSRDDSGRNGVAVPAELAAGRVFAVEHLNVVVSE